MVGEGGLKTSAAAGTEVCIVQPAQSHVHKCCGWHMYLLLHAYPTLTSTESPFLLCVPLPPPPPQVEQAGGASSADGKQISGLDVKITNYDQRTQICFGSKGEVKRFEEYM